MIYFLQAEIIGRIKIGCCSRGRLKQRIAALQTASPVKLTLLACLKGSYRRERHLHRRFADAWSHGEWFHPSAALVRLIAKIQGRPDLSPRPKKTIVPSGKLQLAILAHMERHAGMTLPARSIAGAIGNTPDGIRPVLHRLRNLGVIRRHNNGWVYPAPAGPPPADTSNGACGTL
jgi:hypothetical protein